MISNYMFRISYLNIKLKIRMIGGLSVKLAFLRKSKTKNLLVIRVKLRKMLHLQIRISFRIKHK